MLKQNETFSNNFLFPVSQISEKKKTKYKRKKLFSTNFHIFTNVEK